MHGNLFSNKHISSLGGKSISLTKLKNFGFRVPPFITITQSECRDDLIGKKVNGNLKNVSLFAVRSSREGEDGEIKSYAGHYYTVLAVKRSEVFPESQKVIASYESHNGGVIIQEFIPSDIGGVIFSDAGQDKILINANFGLCESVVGGGLCDEYIIGKKNHSLISQKIVSGKVASFYKDGRIQKEICNDEALNKKQLLELVKTAQSIEKKFGSPQDIEFCFYKNTLYILQSRPITRAIFEDEEMNFYDNANIAESYSGMVLPLTFSFAQKVYSEVYKDLLCASGVSRQALRPHAKVFDSMVASFYGRMYYNMNSWYKMMAFIPGYTRNKRNLELMISSNTFQNVKTGVKPSFLFSIKYFIIAITKVITLPLARRIFKKKIRAILNNFRNLPVHSFAEEECKKLFKELMGGPLRKWYITVENDTILMTLYGVWKSKKSDFQSSMPITTKTISAKQINALQELSKNILTDEELATYINTKDRNGFLKCLSGKKYIYNMYQAYFKTYGGRFANELKLESEDIEEDFDSLCSLFRMYNSSPNIFTLPMTKEKKSKNDILARLIRSFATEREEMRLLRANMFSIVRHICKRMGVLFYEQGYIENPKHIFYLKINEIFDQKEEAKLLMKKIVAERIAEYKKYSMITPLSHFKISEEEEAPTEDLFSALNKNILTGQVSSKGNIIGKVRVFEKFTMPEKIDFDIIVASHTDPGWIPLIGLAKGMIIEYGGMLSHASIVSRELGIPAIIGVPHATRILKTGDMVEINGLNGTITIKS